MPKLGFGDMWAVKDEVDLFLITTNSTVINGKLVMGGGIAGAAAKRYPKLPRAFGKAVQNLDKVNNAYYLLISPNWPERKLGAFQTKDRVIEPSKLGLIQGATVALYWWARAHPNARIALNYPGIGLGGLTEDQVWPIIKMLPDNVEVWQYE